MELTLARNRLETSAPSIGDYLRHARDPADATDASGLFISGQDSRSSEMSYCILTLSGPMLRLFKRQA